ncbi:unnamed protein product [Caenorhabditis angaria]|uniref:Uncharacterized protein n=1 Tax=Caenorhabditis angaria TaxID=860376 RepID=A0A9P1N0W0_9PELO|nr:unnamed protein product [Caenorhabditis angaria]
MLSYNPRKFNQTHKTSLFVSLQSTDYDKTEACENSWLQKADDYFIFPKSFMKRLNLNEMWSLSHYSQLMSQTYLNLPHQSRWILFTFDDNFYFIEKLIDELANYDSHRDYYFIIRDYSSKDFHFPSIIMSRNALDTFYENREKCTSQLHSIEDWLTTCFQGVKPFIISRDFSGKSRCFALNRHFEIEEMKKYKKNDYDDGYSVINEHSSSLISFSNLTVDDLRLLPILIDRIVK